MQIHAYCKKTWYYLVTLKNSVASSCRVESSRVWKMVEYQIVESRTSIESSRVEYPEFRLDTSQDFEGYFLLQLYILLISSYYFII